MLSLPYGWKHSLLLLALTTTRREAIAFVQTAFLSSANRVATTEPSKSAAVTSCFVSTSNNHNDLRNGGSSTTFEGDDSEAATTPLSKLVDLSDTYSLQTTAEDTLPLQEGQRLVCVGDVHGDFQALEEFLTIAGVYDSATGQWAGNDTILVQCGDVLDRGSQELKCFSLLSKLSQQAAQQGGHVILLWGNHEALNAQGLFHYTTGEDEYETTLGPAIDAQLKSDRWRYQFSGNQPARWAAYEPGSGVLTTPLLANMKVAVQVGKTVCVHAGLTTRHLDQYGGLKGMNSIAQQYMRKDLGEHNNFGKYGSMEELVFRVNSRAQKVASQLPELLGGGANPDDSPVWMRAFSAPNDAPPKHPKAQQMIDATLFHLQANRMVMGHTVQKSINGALNGKAWRIDVGASRGVMGGQPEVLEVSMENGKEVVSILTKAYKIPGAERLVGVPKPDPMDMDGTMPEQKLPNPYLHSTEKDNPKQQLEQQTSAASPVLESSSQDGTVDDEAVNTNSTSIDDMMQRAATPAAVATAVTAAGELAAQWSDAASQVLGSM